MCIRDSDWAIWIAYAPLMGIFFAIIAYGRTVRQFLVINWILPASFGFVWFSVWGGTALKWQTSGKADIIATIQEEGAVAGIWEFLKHVPLGAIIIPVIIVALIAAFSTTADTMSTTIAALCTKGAKHDEEPAIWQKIVWGEMCIRDSLWTGRSFRKASGGISYPLSFCLRRCNQ